MLFVELLKVDRELPDQSYPIDGSHFTPPVRARYPTLATAYSHRSVDFRSSDIILIVVSIISRATGGMKVCLFRIWVNNIIKYLGFKSWVLRCPLEFLQYAQQY